MSWDQLSPHEQHVLRQRDREVGAFLLEREARRMTESPAARSGRSPLIRPWQPLAHLVHTLARKSDAPDTAGS
jgi:hypothetical protein